MCSRRTSRNNRWMTYGHAFESPNCSEPEPIAPLSPMLTLLPSAKTRSSNLEGNLLLAPASTVCISSAQHVETEKAAERVPSVRLCHMRRWQSPTSHRPCRRRLKALLRLYTEALCGPGSGRSSMEAIAPISCRAETHLPYTRHELRALVRGPCLLAASHAFRTQLKHRTSSRRPRRGDSESTLLGPQDPQAFPRRRVEHFQGHLGFA